MQVLALTLMLMDDNDEVLISKLTDVLIILDQVANLIQLGTIQILFGLLDKLSPSVADEAKIIHTIYYVLNKVSERGTTTTRRTTKSIDRRVTVVTSVGLMMEWVRSEECKHQIGPVFQMMFDSYAKSNDEAEQECMTQAIAKCCTIGQ